VGFVPIELPAGREFDGKRLDALQRAFPAAIELDVERTPACDSDVDLVAFLQLQRLDDRSGKPDGKAVTPFRNLHGALHGYTWLMYIFGRHFQATGGTVPGLGSIGRSLSRPSSFSNSDAACSKAASPRGLPVSCRPVGRPHWSKPHGIASAGLPVTVMPELSVEPDM